MIQELEKMREWLKVDPRRRLYVSVHEAGHERYARRAGAIDMKYHGTTEYPGRPGESGFAGLQAVFPDTGVQMELRVMARWYCAGSVVQKALVPDFWDEGADATDFAVFSEEAVKVTGGQATPQDISDTWNAAKQDVERDLRKPAFRREMWDLAREIEKKIPW